MFPEQGDRFLAGGSAEFAKDVTDMNLDGPDGYDQIIGDPGLRHTVVDSFQDLQFRRGQEVPDFPGPEIRSSFFNRRNSALICSAASGLIGERLKKAERIAAGIRSKSVLTR